MSDLPADLIYATDYSSLKCSKSEENRRATEAHNSLVEQLMWDFQDGDLWPQWADDQAKATYDACLRAHKQQKDAITWVKEHRCPSPDDDDDWMGVDSEQGADQ